MISLIYINTQEWLRLKFLQVAFFLSFAYICISYLLGALSFAEQTRIKFDFGLAGMEIITFIVAAFISTHALYRDIDRKTIQVILARPIARWNLLIGYLGSLFILNGILITFLGLTMILFFDFGGAIELSLFNSLVIMLTILLKSVVIGAFGLMISTVARPMFSLVLTISYWILAYSITDIEYFIKKAELQSLDFFVSALNFTIPQFYTFNWKSYYYIKNGFSYNDIMWSWFHCLGWIFLLLFTASQLIRRKDIV
jgi:ABC-type transport system involved in multi-copper enzyme maturation permease subunit